MLPVVHHISFKFSLKIFAYTFIFDTGIALFLTALKFGGGFLINFIISQCIGLSICTCMMIVHPFFEDAGPALRTVLVAAALLIGSICGSFLGSFLSGLGPATLFEEHSLWQLLLLGLIFGSIITYFFSSREQIAESQARIQEEKIKRLTSEKKAAEADFKRLQAQIEPHFLFNTLSNVLGLLETDPGKGKSMLVDFIQYLRTSLSKIRGAATNLEQEVEIIRAYLNIYKVRMGDRLHYKIDIPAPLQDLPFPPMLLQPLVENAVKHGLESRIEGGEIVICAEAKDGILRLEVADTGPGLSEASDAGLGLANIRERLHSIYGDSAQLILEPNRPHGLKAIIEVPHAGD